MVHREFKDSEIVIINTKDNYDFKEKYCMEKN